MVKKITAKVVFNHLGPGFWGLVDNKGNEYRPVNMPEQLKYEGATVRVTVRTIQEDMSIFMWGSPVKIVSFSTMTP